MDRSYYEYVYKSGDIVYCSLRLERPGWTTEINFLQTRQGVHDDASIKSFDKEHPVREEVVRKHEERL